MSGKEALCGYCGKPVGTEGRLEVYDRHTNGETNFACYRHYVCDQQLLKAADIIAELRKLLTSTDYIFSYRQR